MSYFFLFMVIESFAGYNSLGWHLWSHRVCNTSIQAPLAFRVSIEKSDVILIGMLLYVTWSFFLAGFYSLLVVVVVVFI